MFLKLHNGIEKLFTKTKQAIQMYQARALISDRSKIV